MIRAAVIDGHPAMRAGVEAILARTPDVVVVAGTSGALHEVEHTLYRTAPDVVIVEDAPGGLDGVALARLIKAQPPAPKVVLYADGIEPTQVAAAMLAGADALVDSRGDAAELVAAVRSAARGELRFPELDAKSRADVALLEDCTSAVVVPGADYTGDADAAFERYAAAGMHVVRSTDPIAEWPGRADAMARR